MPAGKNQVHKESGEGRSPFTRSMRATPDKKHKNIPEISPELKTKTPEELIHELQVHQIELETQAEELRRTQLALEESRDQYLDLYDFAPLGYLTLTDEALVSQANLPMAGLLRIERRDLIGSRFRHYVVPEDQHIWDNFFIGLLKSETKLTTTIMLVKKDTSCFPARLEGIRLSGAGDSPHSIRVAVSDISDIRQAERDRRDSERLLKTVIDLLPVGVQVLDSKGHIVSRNPEAERIWGLPHPTDNGKPAQFMCWRLEDGARIDACDTAEMRAIGRGETTLEEQIEIACSDGIHKIVLSSALPIHGSNGSINGAVMVTQDITEGKVAEEEIRWLASYPELNPNPVIELDAEGTVTFANPASRTILRNLGLPNDISCFVPADKVEILRLLKEGSAPQIEREVTIRNETFLENIALEPGLQVVRIYARNITDRKRVEDALRESEERFRRMFSQSIVGKTITYLDGTMEANKAFSDMLGYSEEEFRNLTWREITHPDDLDESDRFSQSLISGERQSGRFIKRYLHKNGSAVWADVSATIERDTNGRPRYLMVTVSDITAIRQAEKAARLANKKLTLLSSITRDDINNQLLTADGFIELLHSNVSDPALEDYFKKLAVAVSRISSLIQSAKAYEQIGVNAPIWQDCRTLVDSAAQKAPHGKIPVKNDLPPGMEVFVDPFITNVCFNLIDNAVRHGGRITAIRFFWHESGDERIIVCEDDGVGIAAEEKEKIFERGYGKNTGLGLPLSRELLDITGITMKETGEPGKGARFEITVPKGAWRVTPAF